MTTIYKKICPLHLITTRQTFGKSISIDEEAFDIFLVHEEGEIYAYQNRCPHTGINLEWQEHRFLNKDNTWIQCSLHGALFCIQNGECVHGPCQGEALLALPVSCENDWVSVDIQKLVR